MKFDKTELVAGIPIPLVRSLMQFFEDGYDETWMIEWVKEKAGVELTFTQLHTALVERGLVVPGEKVEQQWRESYKLTEEGFSLRYAQFNPRLTAKTAARLLEELLVRCQATLRADNPAIVGRVETLFLFGSYARGGQEDYGDIDLVFDYSQKDNGEEQRKLLRKQPGAARYGVWLHTGLFMGHYVQGRTSYLNFCSFENYQQLSHKRPEYDRVIFSASEGGRLDVTAPKTIKSRENQAIYRFGYWDGWDGCTKGNTNKIYGRGWEDGVKARPAPKVQRQSKLKHFHVLLHLQGEALESLPVTVEEKNRWELPHFGTLLSCELRLAETLTNLPTTLKALGLTSIACELVESVYTQELHAHDDRDRYYSTTLPIETHLNGKPNDSPLAQPLLVYRKGTEFLKGLKQVWDTLWQATAKAAPGREIYWHACYDTPTFEESHWDESYVATKAVVLGAKRYKADNLSEKLFDTRLYVSLFTKAVI